MKTKKPKPMSKVEFQKFMADMEKAIKPLAKLMVKLWNRQGYDSTVVAEKMGRFMMIFARVVREFNEEDHKAAKAA